KRADWVPLDPGEEPSEGARLAILGGESGVTVLLVELEADGFIAEHATPEVSVCHVIEGGGTVFLPSGEEISFERGDTIEFADDPPVCIAWARWVPFSSFGPYHEAYVMIRALLRGETYLYQPFIFTDNEIPLVAGRELWGYAKKLAVMGRTFGGAGSPFGEQLVFTVERPPGQRIMTVSMACDQLYDSAELEDLPVLSTRLIPH